MEYFPGHGPTSSTSNICKNRENDPLTEMKHQVFNAFRWCLKRFCEHVRTAIEHHRRPKPSHDAWYISYAKHSISEPIRGINLTWKWQSQVKWFFRTVPDSPVPTLSQWPLGFCESCDVNALCPSPMNSDRSEGNGPQIGWNVATNTSSQFAHFQVWAVWVKNSEVSRFPDCC